MPQGWVRYVGPCMMDWKGGCTRLNVGEAGGEARGKAGRSGMVGPRLMEEGACSRLVCSRVREAGGEARGKARRETGWCLMLTCIWHMAHLADAFKVSLKVGTAGREAMGKARWSLMLTCTWYMGLP